MSKQRMSQMDNQEKILRTINQKATGRPRVAMLTKFKASVAKQDTLKEERLIEASKINKPKAAVFPNLTYS